ncbi:MAG: repair photolyase [Rhodoglobus sp.]|nr:repair photolyase [Rhodoglobus sp.]
MRWSGQELTTEQESALPGLARLSNLVRSVSTPEFAGIRFHEVLAKSALNKVPGESGMPFDWTINPYRGCSHACVFCLGAETLILMADGTQKPIWAIEVGEEIYGTRQEGRYRRYVRTKVLAHWRTRKPAHRVTLADGTRVVASGEHRFLTERGWKHVIGAMSGPGTRPYLTKNNSLMGFGLAGLDELNRAPLHDADYRRGYLCGMIRGGGHLATHEYKRPSGSIGTITQFRLALADTEALHRARTFLEVEGVVTAIFQFTPGNERHRPMTGIRIANRAAFDRITDLIHWRAQESLMWHRGFLAGIFDAEGSNSGGVLRISNGDETLLAQIRESMDELGVRHTTDPPNAIGVSAIRVVGGLAIRQRFFQLTGPAITRKLSIEGMAVKSQARLGVVSIESLGHEEDMYDITTGTGDFIANGVISHNCFARNTHTYLDLDAGKDFDSEIIVKVNVAEVLAKELARASWKREGVALGTNTDPYQRAEGRYRLMPGIIAALAESGTPFSILTKGSLLRRDLPLLVEAGERVPVHLAMTIAVHDDDLQKSVEPGAPTTKSRLETVRAVREHGLDVAVLMMPVLPYLTDTRAHLDHALEQIRQAGGTSVSYSALHLRPGAREWYLQWLEREHPDLVGKYAQLYAKGAYAPKEYRMWLAERMRPLLRKHGLERPGTVKPARGTSPIHERSLIAEELPDTFPQPRLF